MIWKPYTGPMKRGSTLLIFAMLLTGCELPILMVGGLNALTEGTVDPPTPVGTPPSSDDAAKFSDRVLCRHATVESNGVLEWQDNEGYEFIRIKAGDRGLTLDRCRDLVR